MFVTSLETRKYERTCRGVCMLSRGNTNRQRDMPEGEMPRSARDWRSFDFIMFLAVDTH